MISGQLVRNPHGESVFYAGQGDLVILQRYDFFIVNQQAVRVFDFEISRIGGFEFDHATLDRIVDDHAQRLFQESRLVLEFFCHRASHASERVCSLAARKGSAGMARQESHRGSFFPHFAPIFYYKIKPPPLSVDSLYYLSSVYS